VDILSKSLINQTVKAAPQNIPKVNPPGYEIPAPIETHSLARLATELNDIRVEMLELEAAEFGKLDTLHHTQTESARNLIHYLALRRHDRRHIQEKLSLEGLSSLGRAESHVKASVDAIAGLLRRLRNMADVEPSRVDDEASLGYAEGLALLESHTESLLGPKPAHRDVRIMVTMPSEAADDYVLVLDLVKSGMNCMRINCAYDDAKTWTRMIDNLHRAIAETGKSCRILMDLPGPKLRTGPMERGPQVVKWRPLRDVFGCIKQPARIWLTPAGLNELPPAESDASLPVRAKWLRNLNTGDVIKFFDARGASRSIKVVEPVGNSWWAESNQTAYVATGTSLHIVRSGMPQRILSEGRVGELPAQEQWIFLKEGYTLILTRELEPGRPAVFDDKGGLLTPPRIGVTLPEIFDEVRAGERIWLDDGVIEGLIKSVNEHEIEVLITHTRPHGKKLRADKGINLPESALRLPPLTELDRRHLEFIARNADLVGYSFVRSADDVAELQDSLARLNAQHLGVVLKIETRRAFEQLPNLLLEVMRSPCAGVMIARGDLAIECGWERMAEVQEEILWISEAAHMPVIWATQVLEKLTKEGLPSRAEITDAAMGERAECVMLNKGPYVVDAVRALDDILRRMENHQRKKRSMLRQLRLADHLSCTTRKGSNLVEVEEQMDEV
jgi:pyruvate kinase